jgi:predicted phosphodiesterase
MAAEHPRSEIISRRAVLQGGVLVLAAATVEASLLADEPTERQLRFGLVTDLHYADKSAAGTRHYRQTLDKLGEAAAQFQSAEIDFVAELGDLIDAADSVELEQRYLTTVNRAFAAIAPERHYVLGNHCVDTLTKQEFLGSIERERSYYSFDRDGFHFVVLDACFRDDGQPYQRRNFHWTDANIPPAELDWLQDDLRQTSLRTIVLAHQRLDVSNNHGVKNAAAVRQVLETSGKVLAVFQGHSHHNDLNEIAGIHYCTLVAMVEGSGMENNGYSIVDLVADGTIRVSGFRKQSDYHWPPQA